MESGLIPGLPSFRHLAKILRDEINNTAVMTAPEPNQPDENLESEYNLINSLAKNPEVIQLARSYDFYNALWKLANAHNNFLDSRIVLSESMYSSIFHAAHTLIGKIIEVLHQHITKLSPDAMQRFFSMFYNLCDKGKSKKDRIERISKTFERMCQRSLNVAQQRQQQQKKHQQHQPEPQQQQIPQIHRSQSQSNAEQNSSPSAQFIQQKDLPRNQDVSSFLTPEQSPETSMNPPEFTPFVPNGPMYQFNHSFLENARTGLLGNKRNHSETRNSIDSIPPKNPRLSTETACSNIRISYNGFSNENGRQTPTMNIAIESTDAEQILEQFLDNCNPISNPEGNLCRSSLVYDNEILNTNVENNPDNCNEIVTREVEQENGDARLIPTTSFENEQDSSIINSTQIKRSYSAEDLTRGFFNDKNSSADIVQISLLTDDEDEDEDEDDNNIYDASTEEYESDDQEEKTDYRPIKHENDDDAESSSINVSLL